jgi:hypothetical protein
VLVPIILGSDKTTVSVVTGDNSYWPLYLSIGNIHNMVHRAHRNGVAVLAFLVDAKSKSFIVLEGFTGLTDLWIAERKFSENLAFRKFRQQLFHTSLTEIPEPLRSAMTTPIVMQCGDGQYRCFIFSLGPYIADYPEQCMIAGVVQGWCTRYLFHFLRLELRLLYRFSDASLHQGNLTHSQLSLAEGSIQ